MPRTAITAMAIAHALGLDANATALLICANCSKRTYAFLEVRTALDVVLCHPVPLCRRCFVALDSMKGTVVGDTGIAACGELMQERTGKKWLSGDGDSFEQ